jgi:hypothetical protein
MAMASGSSVFVGANAERSTVAIDPNRSFLIVRLNAYHCSKYYQWYYNKLL